MNPITVLIVDDEPLARSSIRRLLQPQPDFSIVGEAADGATALRLLREKRPQLVFLDVQMPELTGVEVLASLTAAEWPAVIFTTAYHEHAVKAFEFHAIDYLLKPYKDARFAAALQRAADRIRQREPAQLVSDLTRALTALRGVPSENPPPSSGPARSDALPDRLVVKVNGEFQFLPLGDIFWIEGHGDYLKLHCRGGAPLVRDTFKDLQERLPANRFLRIHKSAMVNVDYARKLRPLSSGDAELEIADGTVLRVSRLNKPLLERFV